MQRKNAEEEVQLAKKQEESEAVRQAHRDEARLREDYIQRRLQAKVCYPSSAICHTSQHQEAIVGLRFATLPLPFVTPHSIKQQLWSQGKLPFCCYISHLTAPRSNCVIMIRYLGVDACHTSQQQAVIVKSRFATFPLPLLTPHSTKKQL